MDRTTHCGRRVSEWAILVRYWNGVSAIFGSTTPSHAAAEERCSRLEEGAVARVYAGDMPHRRMPTYAVIPAVYESGVESPEYAGARR